MPEALAPVTTTSQPNAGLGDRFNADQAAIDERVAAANAVEDPAERAEALAALASDIRELQEQWTGADTQGWTLGVDHDNDPDTPRLPTTASEWWGDYAVGIETTADANRSAAEDTAASQQAVADFNAAVAPGALSPADYARLAEEWRNRPDNELVRIPIDDPALAEGGGVVHQTPSGYFARLSGDPALRQYQRDQVELMESQGVDTSERTDAEIAALAQPVFDSAQRQYQRDRVETREAVEAIIGEVEGPLTQEHVDQASRVIGIDNERSERQAFRDRVETREAVEAVIGEVEGPITQEHVDPGQPHHRH